MKRRNTLHYNSATNEAVMRWNLYCYPTPINGTARARQPLPPTSYIHRSITIESFPYIVICCRFKKFFRHILSSLVRCKLYMEQVYIKSQIGITYYGCKRLENADTT